MAFDGLEKTPTSFVGFLLSSAFWPAYAAGTALDRRRHGITRGCICKHMHKERQTVLILFSVWFGFQLGIRQRRRFWAKRRVYTVGRNGWANEAMQHGSLAKQSVRHSDRDPGLIPMDDGRQDQGGIGIRIQLHRTAGGGVCSWVWPRPGRAWRYGDRTTPNEIPPRQRRTTCVQNHNHKGE